MLLNNNSKYKIFNIEHTINSNLIFKKDIPMTSCKILEILYNVIKYTTNFLKIHNIEYSIISGTLIGCVRHNGIIPWDNDIDIMIFKKGYDKLLNLIDEYNSFDKFKIINCTPGFKLFYDNIPYGELFTYDYNQKEDCYMLSYPYINNKPTFHFSAIYFPWLKYKHDTIFPLQKIQFEDFEVMGPNNITRMLQINYKNSNILECIYNSQHNELHGRFGYNMYRILNISEKITFNKLLIILYIICHKIVKKIFLPGLFILYN